MPSLLVTIIYQSNYYKKNDRYFFSIVPRETKPDRWVEVASPYINYPTASALHM